jgi:hypothetical protein
VSSGAPIAALAVHAGDRLAFYPGYTRGLEESGIGPATRPIATCRIGEGLAGRLRPAVGHGRPDAAGRTRASGAFRCGTGSIRLLAADEKEQSGQKDDAASSHGRPYAPAVLAIPSNPQQAARTPGTLGARRQRRRRDVCYPVAGRSRPPHRGRSMTRIGILYGWPT